MNQSKIKKQDALCEYFTLSPSLRHEPHKPMTHRDLRHLTTLVNRATAALIPIAADGEGRDHHGGRLASPAAVVAQALADLETAGAMAAQFRRSAGHPGEGANP